MWTRTAAIGSRVHGTVSVRLTLAAPGVMAVGCASITRPLCVMSWTRLTAPGLYVS
ncbi:hypothetical protein D3C84_1311770 [compost metagenome]